MMINKSDTKIYPPMIVFGKENSEKAYWYYLEEVQPYIDMLSELQSRQAFTLKINADHTEFEVEINWTSEAREIKEKIEAQMEDVKNRAERMSRGEL